MASGDLTASTPSKVEATDVAAIKVAIDALNLAIATDTLFVIPIHGNQQVQIFKVQREA